MQLNWPESTTRLKRLSSQVDSSLPWKEMLPYTLKNGSVRFGSFEGGVTIELNSHGEGLNPGFEKSNSQFGRSTSLPCQSDHLYCRRRVQQHHRKATLGWHGHALLGLRSWPTVLSIQGTITPPVYLKGIKSV